MDKDTYLDSLKTIKELILDEEKLVTYISLSKDLCIHVNAAKSLLNRVIKEIRESETKTTIHVCFLISGLLDNNTARTTVCSEVDFEPLKKTFKLIFFEHVYCVSRGLQDADNVALGAVNKFEDLPLCTGLIKANLCIKRTNDEIGNLKYNSNQAMALDSKPKLIAPKKKSTEKVKETSSNAQISVVKANSEPIINSKTPSPKKDATANNIKNNLIKNSTKSIKGIAGFFNKTNGDLTKNSKVKVENSFNDSKIKSEIDADLEAHNSDNLFNTIKNEKAITKSSDISSGKSQKDINKNDNIKLKNGDNIIVGSKSQSQKSLKTPDTIKNVQSSNKSQDKTSKNTALKNIKKNAKIDKKRKRVLLVSDSESETEDPFADDDNKMLVNHESEDEIPPTPTVNTVKITSGIINPKKRRKVVDKTYTDEDGFILTKKEEVYESCSDNEVDMKTDTQEKENVKQATQIKVEPTQVKSESPQKASSKSKKKKVSPPQKGKQQMMTNFFKKV